MASIARRPDGRWRPRYRDAAGKEQKLECEKLIVSIGRVPNTTGLNAEAVGLKLDERGFIAVDDDYTNAAGAGLPLETGTGAAA